MSKEATEVGVAMVRIPERAGLALAAALQRIQRSQVEYTAAMQLVADALDVPQGWVLGGDRAGLFFGEPMESGEEKAPPSMAADS